MTIDDLIQQIERLLRDLSPLLRKQLSDQASPLISDLTKLDTYYWPVLYLSGHLREYIIQTENEKMQAQDPSKKISEKEMAVKAEMAHLFKLLEITEAAGDSLKRKINLGQSVLKHLGGTFSGGSFTS